jgi:hypothetical protein
MVQYATNLHDTTDIDRIVERNCVSETRIDWLIHWEQKAFFERANSNLCTISTTQLSAHQKAADAFTESPLASNDNRIYVSRFR